MIPYGRQDVSEEDIAAVSQVLRGDLITQGPMVERFESAIAAYCGVPYAVAVSSGTAALHLAYLAAGLGPGDTGWTSPNTFLASSNAMLYCGARPDFVDIDPGTWNLDPQALEQKLKHCAQAPRILVPVHFAGLSCDMEAIAELAGQCGATVIEDASHALGGRYRDLPVGACIHSDMTVFSFHPVKPITAGEGGMILTRRADLHEKLLLLRSHGMTRDPAKMTGESEGLWYYQQVALGFNYRLTDIQAALGKSQLQRLGDFTRRRAALAARYDALLADLPLTPQQRPAEVMSAHHLYVVRLDEAIDRRRVYDELRVAGIGSAVHYIPVHTQPYYRQLGFYPGQFPRAEAYYQHALTLPLYPGLTEQEQVSVVSALRGILQ